VAAKKKGRKPNLSDLFGKEPVPLGPSQEEIEAALAIPDPLSRAEKVAQMIEQWNEVSHGFGSEAEFKKFVTAQSQAAVTQLVTCRREALAILMDRLANPGGISNKDLVSMLAELGRQLKGDPEVAPVKAADAKAIQDEITKLEEELGIGAAITDPPLAS
jgi:hypothetical protein